LIFHIHTTHLPPLPLGTSDKHIQVTGTSSRISGRHHSLGRIIWTGSINIYIYVYMFLPNGSPMWCKHVKRTVFYLLRIMITEEHELSVEFAHGEILRPAMLQTEI